MTPVDIPQAENLRVLTFLFSVLAVYVWAAWEVLQIVLRRFSQNPAPLSPARARIRSAVLGLAVFGVGCMAYGYWIEPYWPEVTRTRFESSKIPAGSPPLRIVLLSDLHSDPKVRLEDRLPRIIASEKPDLILFSGDCVNSPAGLDNFRRTMRRLTEIAPTYGVMGNWDTTIWPGLQPFQGTPVRVLDNEAVQVSIGKIKLWIIGIPADGAEQTSEVLRAIPENALTVLVHHYPYPDILSDSDLKKVDLFCAGHVHGGQVALPFYGALMTLSRFGKQYEAGLYDVGSMKLYVTRGIGMEGGPAPRVRFCSRPEISIIDISPQN
jgi:uncharacterized protein